MSRIADALMKAGTPTREPDATDASLDSFGVTAEVGRKPGPVSLAASRPDASGVHMPPPPVARPAALEENERLIASSHIDAVVVQQYKKLASTLHQIQHEKGLRSLLVTSAVAGEGKTLTASNLALALSESLRKRVLLIDADLRRPMLHVVFGVKPEPGLSGTLAAGSELAAQLVSITERLALLPGGRPTPDPVGGLTSDRMRQFIEEASQAFDWVIVDTPPVNLFSDATLLSMIVDGALMVVHASKTPSAQAQRAVASLSPERIVGVVLNRTEDLAPQDGYYAYADYAHYASDGGQSSDRNSGPAAGAGD